MLKKYLKSYIFLFGLIIIMTLILSIINYFYILNDQTFKIIIPIISIFFSSIMLGKESKEKGYIEGLKFSIILLILMIIVKLISQTNFNLKVIIIYLVFIFTGVIGAMLGINLKKIKK